MPDGDLLAFMAVVAFAIVFAELQVRRVATTRYICLMLTWVITTAMLIWLAYG
jgi:hypothetical protein